jgi:uncharacterized protein YjbI with pentapeptide repeats
MTADPVTPASLPPARQDELRAARATNEAAERPPYAWTRLDAADVAWLIQEHGWAVEDAPGPRVDLRQANLAHIDLAGQMLRFARFEGAVLYGANLRDADLFFSHFTGADLRAIQADGAQMALARMREARLAGAQLQRVNLRQCWLPEADLSGATLDEADMTSSRMERVDLHEASLKKAKMTWCWLQEADLRAATLFGADLRGATLSRAQCDSADLHYATLEGAWCDDVSFYGAHLEGVDLRGAKLDGAHLAGAYLTGARLAHTDLAAVDLTQLADLAQLLGAVTGDEVAFLAAPSPERAAAATMALDALTRLYAALELRQALTPPQARRLRQRIQMLRRSVARGK